MEPSKTKPEEPKNKVIEKNVESDSSMFSFTIRFKLILAILITSLVPLCALLYSLDQKIEDKLMEINENRLISLREEKKLQIEGYFQQINNQIATFSQDHMIASAMKEFSQAFLKVELEMGEYLDSQKEKKLLQRYEYQLKNTLGSGEDSLDRWLPKKKNSKILQSLYISNNPNPIGKKHKLDFASDLSSYTEIHKKYHSTIREFLERFGYYDIFLAEPKSGHIVYSVFKEVDFSTSLLNGPYAETGIGRVFQAALNSSKPDAVFFEDFEPYEPSYNAPAAFISSPIFENGVQIGVLIFQAPIDRINSVMTSGKAWQRVGLGNSGEVYLVGPDFKMRNDSRFLIEDPSQYFEALNRLKVDKSILEKSRKLNTSIGLNLIKTKGTSAALKGETGFDIFGDYRNIPVLSAYAPVSIMELNWAILAEIDLEEALEARNQIRWWALNFLAVLIIALAFITGILSKVFSRPIVDLAKAAKEVSKGNTKVSVRSRSRDEIGNLAKCFNEMVGNIKKAIEHQVDAIARTAATLKNSTGDISSAVNQQAVVSAQQSSSVSEISATLEELARSSGQIARNSHEVVDASENSLQESEKGMEALRSLKDQMEVITSDNVNSINVVLDLGKKSKEIGKVMGIIDNVANQTKLIAFNASIEASGAGFAGRRFGVVAVEIRKLAENVKKSTDEIRSTIQEIQETVERLVIASENGGKRVQEVAHLAENTFAQLETLVWGARRANNAAEKISESIERQEESTAQVVSAIKEIEIGILKNSDTATKTNKTVESLSTLAIELARLVEELRKTENKTNGASQ